MPEGYSCQAGSVKTSYGCVEANVFGNGIKESGEECDDGNFLEGDGCSIDGKIEPCFDFDGDKTFDESMYTWSFTSKAGEYSYDHCVFNNTLEEYYCGIDFWRWDFWNSFEYQVRSKLVECPYGCENGACLTNVSQGTSVPIESNASYIPIYTCQDLQNMKNNLSASYVLARNIDCFDFDYGDGGGFMPIGNITQPFSGNFDGKGYSIGNLFINRPITQYSGLFGVLAGNVSNLSLINVNIHGNSFIGTIAGISYGIISNSFVNGFLEGQYSIGGLTGENYGVITDSSFIGNITGIDGSDYSGGLVGFNSGTIINSYSSGTHNGYNFVGGLVGFNTNTGVISNSYSLVDVIGYSVGGLVGINEGVIEKSYSIGNVIGSIVGGLVGENVGTIVASYYDNQTSGQSDNGKGIGKTTTEMKTQSTYAGWNFSNTWRIDSSLNDGYPYFVGRGIIYQSCTSLGGIICLKNETCSGNWINAPDSSRCCSGTCNYDILLDLPGEPGAPLD